MNKIFRFFQIYYRGIFRSFYFLIAIVLVVLFLPREGRFKYEFQRGKPWMHGDLFAPFDFPIYKSETEVFEEKNHMLKDFKPFYRLDTSVLRSAIAQFRIDFQRQWVELMKGSDPQFIKRDLDYLRRGYESKIIELLQFVYGKGIVDQYDKDNPLALSVRDIAIIEGNVVHEAEMGDVFTHAKAFEYVANGVKTYARGDGSLVAQYIQQIDIKKAITPNLIYDERITARVRDDLIANISLTKGMVQAGERIVSRGEIITTDIYQVLESLKREYELRLGLKSGFYILVGQVLIVSLLFFVLYLFLLSFRSEILYDDSKTLFILLLITFMVMASSVVLKSTLVSIYVIPFAIVPIFIRAFYDSRLALFIHLVTIFLVGFFAPNGYEFVFINFIAGVIAIVSLTSLYRRGRLFRSALLVLLSYCVVYLGLVAVQEGTPLAANWFTFVWFAGNALLLLISHQLIYLFEKLFGFLSDTTLMELSDTNQDLLRKLAEVAPGTFQHSLQVANLAEAATFKVGGNPLLVRAGALYHDIGKMSNPLYFIENQPPEFNPHDHLDFDESASTIIKHVPEGVQIARKNKLPVQLIDFIRTHHGTTKVQYFYRRYLDKYSERVDDPDKFTYPGPRPMSKETVILMMADAVEAASRSLKNITFQKIDELVESIVTNQQYEDQFNDANITFKDITTIKMVFKKKLMNIYHARVEYPESR